jgi:hypothetical protein
MNPFVSSKELLANDPSRSDLYAPYLNTTLHVLLPSTLLHTEQEIQTCQRLKQFPDPSLFPLHYRMRILVNLECKIKQLKRHSQTFHHELSWQEECTYSKKMEEEAEKGGERQELG